MNNLLIFFALPIATIIISIALQKIFKCPPLVAAIIFAIFLIVTFIIGDLNFLIATIVYTIISFITATIVCLVCRIIRRLADNNNDNDDNYNCSSCRRQRNSNSCGCTNNTDSNELLTINSNCGNSENGNLLTISSNGCNGVSNQLLTISSNNANGTNSGCGCNNNTNEITARINVIPNSSTNGRTGQFSGCYRR